MIPAACIRNEDNAERRYGRLSKMNESNEQPKKGALRGGLEHRYLMWNIVTSSLVL